MLRVFSSSVAISFFSKAHSKVIANYVNLLLLCLLIDLLARVDYTSQPDHNSGHRGKKIIIRTYHIVHNNGVRKILPTPAHGGEANYIAYKFKSRKSFASFLVQSTKSALLLWLCVRDAISRKNAQGNNIGHFVNLETRRHTVGYLQSTFPAPWLQNSIETTLSTN